MREYLLLVNVGFNLDLSVSYEVNGVMSVSCFHRQGQTFPTRNV